MANVYAPTGHGRYKFEFFRTLKNQIEAIGIQQAMCTCWETLRLFLTLTKYTKGLTLI